MYGLCYFNDTLWYYCMNFTTLLIRIFTDICVSKQQKSHFANLLM